MKAKCDDYKNHMDWHSIPCSVKETSADAFEFKNLRNTPNEPYPPAYQPITP